LTRSARSFAGQAKYNHDLKLTTLATDKPDTIRVVGRLDLYELAKAIENR